MSSVLSIKLIKKKKIEKSVSDCSSTRPPVESNYSFQIAESYFEDDPLHSTFRPPTPSDNFDSDENSIISVVSASGRDEMFESFQDPRVRVFGDVVVDEFVSTRPPHSARKSIKTVSRINHSSGRCLNLTFVGDKNPSIKDISDIPSTSIRPKLSARLRKPESIISDISKQSKTSIKSKSCKSDKS